MIGELISNGLGFLKELFGWKREQGNRENTPEMQQNAKAAQDAQVVDQARKDVGTANVDAVRRDLS